MDAAMLTSFYKYGPVADAYPERVNALESMAHRLKLYSEGERNPHFGVEGEPEFYVEPGNVEYLADAANFAMIEFMFPSNPLAHFTPTDASGSPGRIAQNKDIYDRPTQIKNSDLEPNP
jgi:hypothetical protein